MLNQLCSPNPKRITSSGLGSFYFARHYFRNRFFFLFLWVLRCFSSPRSLLIHYFTHVWITSVLPLAEFPHSDIHGLSDICSYPWLFAAYHVLLRLLMPRHSPYALSSLTYLASSNQKLLCHLLKKYSSYTYVLFIVFFFRFLVIFNFTCNLYAHFHVPSKSISVNFLKLLLVCYF